MDFLDLEWDVTVYLQAAEGTGHVLGCVGHFAWFVFQGTVCSRRGLCSMGSRSVIGLYRYFIDRDSMAPSIIEAAVYVRSSSLTLSCL